MIAMKQKNKKSIISKRLWIILPLFLLLSLSVQAQPKWAKKASKSVFTLKTFAADGTLTGSSTGFFVGEQGEAISSFSPFKGASRAIVVDAEEKEYEVACLLGANEMYDVAKFRVDIKKPQVLPMSAAALSEGVNVWLLPYRELKKVPEGVVRKAETFQEYYSYYTVAMQMPETAVGAPLLNENGEVVGLMQQPSSAADTLSYAVSVIFADSLKISGLSINDAVMRSTNIKKAIPTDLGQAQLALFLGVQSLDSAAYATLVDDFVAQFPNEPDGYICRAELSADGNRFAEADQSMEQALKVSQKKDETHYSYSRLIYQKLLYKNGVAYEPWTLERSLQEVNTAYDLNPMPTYLHQKALVLYSMKKYQEAFDDYMKLSQSDMRSADIFFEASRCQLMMGDTLRQLAMLDSAVALFSRPYLREAAPYILARAQARLDAKKYREAVADLNDYEELMRSQLTANFYYLRFQADMGGRLFQQALNDIDKAISMEPKHDLYYAEKASLQVRVGLYDDAMVTARKCIEVYPEGSDGYLFLGVAQCQKGQKQEGLKNLQKAKELGDPQADGLIERYSK